MSKKQPGGYAFRQEVVRAVNANRTARDALRRLLEERPGPQATAMLIAKVAQALSEILDALREIEQIGRNWSSEERTRQKEDAGPKTQ
jgi:hypothetical protein